MRNNGKWKLCQKISIGQYCPIFKKAEGKKSCRNYRLLLETCKTAQYTYWALEPCYLESNKVTVDTLLTNFAYQFPHPNMEIKTMPASCGCWRHKWVLIYVKHLEHYWYLVLYKWLQLLLLLWLLAKCYNRWLNLKV